MPQSLLGARRIGQTELVRARTFFNGPVQLTPKGKPVAFEFKAYKEDDVRHSLERIFFGKCAYCEARYDVSGPVDVEHYRPKGSPTDAAGHRGYWWLAGRWENLLPSCLDCNRRRYQDTPIDFSSLSMLAESQRHRAYSLILTGKGSEFPIQGVRLMTEPPANTASMDIAAERALLLQPCEDEPADHIRFYIERSNPIGIVYPVANRPAAAPILPLLNCAPDLVEAHAKVAQVSVRGAVSIQVLGLNRVRLVQERTRIQRRLEFLGSMIINLSGLADELEASDAAGRAAVTVGDGVAKLRSAVQRLIAEVNAHANPEAPFSAMASAWIAQFQSDLAKTP